MRTMTFTRPHPWLAVFAPSVSGGLWVVYGWARWPSYSHWLVPGTVDPSKW